MSDTHVMSDTYAAAGQQAVMSDLLNGGLQVTQEAALAASMFFGRRNEQATDVAAADAMRRALAGLQIRGTVVLGEGVRGVAPILYNGELIGSDGPAVDIALNAVEGAASTAMGRSNSISVMAMVEDGTIMRVPDVYMTKIAIGPGLPDDVVDLDAPVADNIRNLADAKGVDPGEIVVCMLDRPRHDSLFAKVINAGARTMAIPDGDISGIVSVAMPDSPIDLYMGTGGAPEGVLAAAALKCFGGRMRARLLFRNDDERAMAQAWGIKDFTRVYRTKELVTGNVAFAATGITDGILLKGVRRRLESLATHSVVADTASGGFEFIESRHERSVN